jgi:hypothetical protein
MWTWWLCLTPDGQVKFLGLLGATFAFAIGLFQYRKAQRWKRSEWVAKEMKDFFGDPAVKTALQLLDWGSRKVQLFPDKVEPEQRFVRVSDEDLRKALMYHSDHGNFSETEAALRDLFDHFLDRLERINSFVDAHLLSSDDVRPYLDYWADHVIAAGDGGTYVDRLVQLRRYIRSYRFTGVEALFRKLSKRPFPEPKNE